jgi:hypothetical protein
MLLVRIALSEKKEKGKMSKDVAVYLLYSESPGQASIVSLLPNEMCDFCSNKG